MADQVLPSKLVGERITVRFEFMDELEWGESIESATFRVKVVSGLDPRPQDMLFGGASIDGSFISQQIYEGVPGVIYSLTGRVIGSSGQVYEKYARLAVLPSSAKKPPFIATYYTTPPYPIIVIESLTSGGDMLEGKMIRNVLDSVMLDASILRGTLRALKQDYGYNDSLSVDGNIISGTLRNLKITYEYEDFITLDASILNGTLAVLKINYAHEDYITLDASILSGTLS